MSFHEFQLMHCLEEAHIKHYKMAASGIVHRESDLKLLGNGYLEV